MGIEEFLPAILVLAVIYYAIRWFMGPSQTSNPDGSIPGVTASMVETIQSAFPDIPLVNIVYHLSKTRSAQATSEEILERGFLPAPPAGYQIPPSLAPTPAPTATSPVIGKRTAPTPGKSLIDRYGLSARIPSVDKGKGKEKAGDESETPTGQPGQGQGVGKWEGSKEERERGLRERKEKMVLEARRRMMERQQEQARKAEEERERATPTYIA